MNFYDQISVLKIPVFQSYKIPRLSWLCMNPGLGKGEEISILDNHFPDTFSKNFLAKFHKIW